MRLLPVAMFVSALLPVDALACGGFFCDASQPVFQAGEEIVFAIDEDTVTAHVSIAYEGPAEEFAWIVPVPSEPSLFESDALLFAELRSATNPQFQVRRTQRGVCEVAFRTSLSPFSAQQDPDGVTVVDEVRVGPYDTVTLQALNSDVLIDWLQTNGYDLPSDLSPKLAPYVAANQFFVALKLASDADVGQISPLGMTYPATTASIPIQLTAVAALPDMPVDVYVFGNSRAVPDNYLHIEANEAAYDWYSTLDSDNGAPGSNYFDVLSDGVDEAGGHAFATTFSDRSGSVPGSSEQLDILQRQFGHLTRLSTTLDPEEMTVDPVFVLNADVEQFVSNIHSATDERKCGFYEGRRAERNLILDDGRKIRLPSQPWASAHETYFFELTEELHTPAALLIEDLGAEGQGEVLFDYREQAALDAKRFSRPGCGCSSSSSSAHYAFLLLPLSLLRRRRQQGSERGADL
ncbi:MAG: DUF2330 domain-containing protein [Proteobacteria bacterium]|nr:DUF2330 domain-containing protein [Pseudomonadota bacterium]